MKLVSQDLIDRLKSGSMTVDEIRLNLYDNSAVVRCQAIEAMVAKIVSHPEVLHEVVNAIRDPKNAIRLMGTISVAHVGLKSLFGSSQEAKEYAKQLLANWDETERDDLLWFLKSEGVVIH